MNKKNTPQKLSYGIVVVVVVVAVSLILPFFTFNYPSNETN